MGTQADDLMTLTQNRTRFPP